MKMDRVPGRRIAGFVVIVFVAGMLWWMNQRRAQDATLLYDLSRIGRTDLVHLRVELHSGARLAGDRVFLRGT